MDTSTSKYWKSGGKKCAAFGCSNNYYSQPKISMFKFPSPSLDKERYDSWVKRVRKSRANWKGPPPESSKQFSNSVLCSQHFTQDQFEQCNSVQIACGFKLKPRLKPTAIPTQFFRRIHDQPSPKKRKLNKLQLLVCIYELDKTKLVVYCFIFLQNIE